MSYDYPTKKYPTAADVDATAGLLALRQSDSAVSGSGGGVIVPTTGTGGIVASGSPAVANLTTSDTSLAYFKATADVFMYRLGYLAQNEAACTGSSTFTLTTYSDFPNMPSANFTIPLAGTYLVHLDIVGFFQSTGTFGVGFRMANTQTGLAGNSASWNWYPPAVNQRLPRFCARTPMTMVEGTNTLRVQCRMFNAGDVMGFDTTTVRAITVTS